MKKILIIFFAAELVWKLVLKYLNYEGDSSPETRARILKFFTEADITVGQEYSRSGFYAGLGSFAVKNILMFFMAFSPLSARLEDIVKKWSRDREWLTNMLFVLAAYTVMTVLFLPLDFYFSYVLEHKFGFSNMTVGAWFWRECKNFILGAVFMTIAVLPSLWIIKKVQFYWIFIVPTAGIIFGLFMSVVYPVLILPVYYDVEKIQEGSLKTKIMKLADSSKIPVSEIFIIKESEYSNHTNAFFVGFGDNKKIYLYDTLIKKNSEEETISVLAHEIGHWKYNHQIKGIVYEFIFSLLEFGLLYFCL
ncbi:MAG TPA: M48 family metallopeptidase, partial [Leptospiraceae bacterium]|nr:M48 family metallopeptidase [Leptospiraceae bacterium]